MYFKVMQKGAKLVTPTDQVAYVGLFLLGRALEWFKPYFIEIQANGVMTTNPDIWYVFAS